VLIGLRLGMACDRFAGEQKLGGCFDTVIIAACGLCIVAESGGEERV